MARRKHQSVTRRRQVKKRGRGLINTLIDKLPVELHVPGYNYCGPGTKLQKILDRGDIGVNPLDEACKNHDIAYSKNQSLEDRHKADWILENKAWERVKSKEAKVGEKAAAWFVTTGMKVKRKLGMGLKRNHKKKGGQINLKIARRRKSPLKKSKQRIIPIPKTGGFLPLLLPILGALGALGGGAAGIAKAVNDAKANREELAEQQRHNRAMENTAKGKGLYMRPYKGRGLFMKPYSKNLR